MVTADQRNSRRSVDQVPVALAALAASIGPRMVLPFERTAGDEIQALTQDAAAVVASVLILTRLTAWHVGIGLGPVELPLPESTRVARGPAYLAARTAVGQARSAPANLCLVATGGIGTGIDAHAVQRAEAALVMLRTLTSRRSAQGWEVIDVLEATGSGRLTAQRLGISPSAVSQRAARAARAESLVGTRLAESLLADALVGAR